MTQCQQAVDGAVPVRTAHGRWIRSESFPRFMNGVPEVRRVPAPGRPGQVPPAGGPVLSADPRTKG